MALSEIVEEGICFEKVQSLIFQMNERVLFIHSFSNHLLNP